MDVIQDLLDDLAVAIYRPPLIGRWNDRTFMESCDPLATLMLVFEYRTAVELGGASGFFGNSTGLLAIETVSALRRAGLSSEADCLTRATELAVAAGIVQGTDGEEQAGDDGTEEIEDALHPDVISDEGYRRLIDYAREHAASLQMTLTAAGARRER